MGGIGSYALRGIRHEGVRQAAIDDISYELVWIEHPWIGHYGHGLYVADLLDEGANVLVPHLLRNQSIPEKTSINGHRRVERIKAGRNFHGLYLVHRLPCREEGTAQIQRRPAGGIMVLYHQILHLLGIHKRGGESMLLGFNIVIVLESV